MASTLRTPKPVRTHALASSPEECADQLRRLLGWQAGEYREIRVLHGGTVQRAIVSTPEQAATAIKGVRYGAGVYVTINPVRPESQSVKNGGLVLVQAAKGSCATDADIERRNCFVVDLDPRRPAGTSATDEQLADAEFVARKMVGDLAAEGWPRPTQVCSGNGVHLYWPVDLPGNSTQPQALLDSLSARFSTDSVKLDTTVGNASRIMRVPGTWSAKGDDADLHRVCALREVGDGKPLPAKALESTAGSKNTTTSTTSQPASLGHGFDVDAWLQRMGVRHNGRSPWPGGGEGAYRWVLPTCPFNPEHDRAEAVVTQGTNGACGFKCQHDSCSSYGWQEFRSVIESAVKSRAVQSGPRQPYPVDALPALLQDVVTTQTTLMDVDPAAVAIPVITALLASVGNGAEVVIHSRWREALVAWSVLIGESGTMKTGTLDLVGSAIRHLESGFPPPEPGEKRQRLATSDSTVEALGDIASHNPRGLLLLRDELSGFLNGIGQYKRQARADESFWLSACNGTRHDVDRKSGSISIHRLLVSILGGIQPKVIERVMRHRGFCESGFAARFWLVWQDHKLLRHQMPTPEQAKLAETVEFKLRLALEAMRSVPMLDGKPTILACEPDAAHEIMQYANDQEPIIYLLPAHSVERAFRAKSRGWVARIAGLLALLREVERAGPSQDGAPSTANFDGLKLTVSDVRSAIRLTEWQVSENVRVLQRLELGVDEYANLERYDVLVGATIDPTTGKTTSARIQQHHSLERSAVEEMLEKLVSKKLWGISYPKPASTGGRPVAEYYRLGAVAIQ